MDTFKIYTAEIENPNHQDGADGWPVGTVGKILPRLQAGFPGVEFEEVVNTVGKGFGEYVGDDESRGDEIRASLSEMLQDV